MQLHEPYIEIQRFSYWDEPNSAMDPISESKFYENFRNITEQKTTIYISHRLASAKFCDNIEQYLMMDKLPNTVPMNHLSNLKDYIQICLINRPVAIYME